jgi:hypothetical protein
MTCAVIALLFFAAIGIACIVAWAADAADRCTWRRLRKRAPYIQD